MRWETPELVEIKMDAEVSEYQDDEGGGRTPWVRAAEPDETTPPPAAR